MTNSEEIIGRLNSSQDQEKIDLIESLVEVDDGGKFTQTICSFIADENKGVRNAATMYILAKQPADAALCLVKFVSSSDITVRNLAGEILIKLGTASIDALIEYNTDKNDDDQKFIIDLLGLITDNRAANHILAILSATENENVILACIEALGNIRYEDSVDILLLLYERNELYKPTVVEALGKIGSKQALDFLMAKYNSEDELTKYSILESFGYLGDVDIYFFLLEQISSIHGPLVWPLITSIFLLKEKYCLDIPFDDRMKNLLMYTLQEGTAEHKKIALSLINVFNDKDILLASLKFLGEDYELDEIIRTKIYRNSDFIFEELPKILSDSGENVRQILNIVLSTLMFVSSQEGAVNISLLQKKNVVHSVSEYLNHYDEEIRRASMEILFMLDPESALLFSDSMIKDENIWNRIRLVEVLEGLNNPEAVKAILQLSEDGDEMIRDRALEVINNRNLKEFFPITK